MGAAAVSDLELPDGLLTDLLEGRCVRPDKVEECRRRLAEGPHPDADAVADAMVREVAPRSHPAVG